MATMIATTAVREDVASSSDGLLIERVALEKRLIEGYYRIEEAILQGQDVADWERFWIELLHQYEVVCKSLERVAA